MSSIREAVLLLNRFDFKHRRVPVIGCEAARHILEAFGKQERVEASLDLGISRGEVLLRGDVVVFGRDEVAVEELREVAEDKRSLYAVVDGGLAKLWAERGGHLYKLVNAGAYTAPTLEIDGIHMHRISGITPWRDSLQKVKLARVGRGDVVLDVCTGLGYTAELAATRARYVLTVEKDDVVLELAEYNPWSRWLESDKIGIVLGDAAEVIWKLPEESFTRIIHDPPRLSIAGELYGIEFYQGLYRVLASGGLLVHYTGAPGRRRGKDVATGVAERLRRAGFEAKLVRELYAVVAYK